MDGGTHTWQILPHKQIFIRTLSCFNTRILCTTNVWIFKPWYHSAWIFIFLEFAREIPLKNSQVNDVIGKREMTRHTPGQSGKSQCRQARWEERESGLTHWRWKENLRAQTNRDRRVIMRAGNHNCYSCDSSCLGYSLSSHWASVLTFILCSFHPCETSPNCT